MQKKLVLCILSAVFYLGLFNLSLISDPREPEHKKPFSITVEAGYTSLTADNFDNTPLFGVRFSYILRPNLVIELRSSYLSSSVESSSDGLGTGTLMVIPMQLTIQYQFPLNEKIIPYIGAGAGYYLNRFSLEDETQWQELGFSINDETDNSTGFHFGVGADYLLKSNFAINLDVRYCIVPLKGRTAITDQISGISQSSNFEGDLNSIMVAAGIKFLF